MAYSYYIYYRVAADRSGACEARIRELLATVEKATGIGGKLLKKREEPLLWMETYENVTHAESFEMTLAQAVARLGIPDFLQPGSSRRVECFVV